MALKLERELSQAVRDLVQRAKEAAHSKNYDYAINLLQQALRQEPFYLDGRKTLRAIEIAKYRSLSAFNRQMLQMKIGATKLSGAAKKPSLEQLVLVEEVLALDPFNQKANALLGDVGVALKCLELKAFAYETLAEGRPEDKLPLTTLAQTYMLMGEPAKAEQVFERILKIDPRDGDALSGLKNASAANASKEGKWESAKDYRDILKNKTEAAQLEQLSKVVKSEEAIDEQIAINFARHQEQPENPAFCKAIGSLYVQKNDIASAIPWYEHAYRSGGGIDTALKKIIDDLQQEKLEADLRILRSAQNVETDPERQAAGQQEISEKERELAQLRVTLSEARVRAHPNDGQLHYDYGEALFKLGEFRKALPEFQVANKQPSVRIQSLKYMGECYLSLRMHDLAISTLADAATELPNMTALKKEIVYSLGLAYDMNNQPAEALEQWKQIYNVDMGYRDVAELVETSYKQG